MSLLYSPNTPILAINQWNSSTGTCESVPGNWVAWQADLPPTNCCEKGMVIPGIPRHWFLCIIWFLLLCYVFAGVALGAEVFMTAIEVVTAKESTTKKKDAEGKEQVFHVKVWNATVANLTLMALGSSAPEILLSIIEVLKESFNSGELGPSTIVGSAAFNLMVITAVCIVCIPAGQTRSLKQLGVFLTTAAYSVVAYIWLLIVVVFWTPERITVWEGILTVVLLLLLIVQAYVVDVRSTAASQKTINVKQIGSPSVTKSEAGAVIKAAQLGSGATAEEIKQTLEDELLPPKSRLYYRKQAMAGTGATPATGAKPSAAKVAPGDDDLDVGRAKKAVEEPAVGAPSWDASAPGILKWKEHTKDVMESGGTVTVEVERVGGAKGEVSCQYATKNQKAVAGKDFVAVDGTLTWADGETEAKPITITIIDDDEFEKDEEFTVVLSEPTGGAAFLATTDGGEEADVCTVTIVNDDDRATKLVEAIRMLRLDADSLDLASGDWKGAIMEAVVPPQGQGMMAIVMHFMMMPWKLLFALCPPPALCGGWPCFIGSLVGIAIQVILINDFATQVGCQLYIKKSTAAITLVALGTSLPDTFASMQAARGDKYADNSIGNVTGSNSVNVFFGLGLPWLVGAVYWSITKVDPLNMADPFVKRYHPTIGTHKLPPKLYSEVIAEGGAFIVRSGELGLSVIVFTVCALLTIALILGRRQMSPPQELGGSKPLAYASAAFLVFLWVVYIAMSTAAAYGFIAIDFGLVS